MKNYQADDYFCRQTYELLTTLVSKMGTLAFKLLIPVMSIRICHAKRRGKRK